MLNPPVTSSVMKSGEKVWYFWVRSCGECGFTGHTLQCLGRYPVLYPSVLEYGTKCLRCPATVTGTAPFQLTTPIRLL